MTEGLDDLYAAVAQLQLPTSLKLDEAVTLSVARAGLDDESDPVALAALLQLHTEAWAAGGKPSGLLRRLVSAGLQAGGTGALDGGGYFGAYHKLVKGTADAAPLSHAVAVRLLSRANLIEHLLANESMSATQILRQLQATESGLRIHIWAVQTVAAALKLKPALANSDVGTTLWQADRERSAQLFPDSDVEQSCIIAANELARWFPDRPVSPILLALSGENGEMMWPYLQLAHWCTSAIEFFDHPPSYIYEFSPRGNAATAIFDLYQVPTGNPALNNAKAVPALDARWAFSRGSTQAQALAELLAILDAVPAVARRHMGRVIRAWLFRILELKRAQPVLVSAASIVEARAVIAAVATDETGTAGVIEQRVVDAIGVLAYPGPEWRERGVGQGVNETNLSRKKLGDVEFTDVDARRVVAIEAHGGRLTAPYVDSHMRSMSRVLEFRVAETWSAIDEPSRWRLTVLYLAHDIGDLIATEETVLDVRVIKEFVPLSRFFEQTLEGLADERVLEVFNKYVIDAMNRANVRESARDRLRALMGRPAA